MPLPDGAHSIGAACNPHERTASGLKPQGQAVLSRTPHMTRRDVCRPALGMALDDGRGTFGVEDQRHGARAERGRRRGVKSLGAQIHHHQVAIAILAADVQQGRTHEQLVIHGDHGQRRCGMRRMVANVAVLENVGRTRLAAWAHKRYRRASNRPHMLSSHKELTPHREVGITPLDGLVDGTRCAGARGLIGRRQGPNSVAPAVIIQAARAVRDGAVRLHARERGGVQDGVLAAVAHVEQSPGGEAESLGHHRVVRQQSELLVGRTGRVGRRTRDDVILGSVHRLELSVQRVGTLSARVGNREQLRPVLTQEIHYLQRRSIVRHHVVANHDRMQVIVQRMVSQPLHRPLELRHRELAVLPLDRAVSEWVVGQPAHVVRPAVKHVLEPERVVEKPHVVTDLETQLFEQRQMVHDAPERIVVGGGIGDGPIRLAARRYIAGVQVVEVRRHILMDYVQGGRPPGADEELVLQRALPVIPGRPARELIRHERRPGRAQKVGVLRG